MTNISESAAVSMSSTGLLGGGVFLGLVTFSY